MTNQISKQLLVIEGNIGAGKSTFLRCLGDSLLAEPIFEPHEKWQNIGGGGENLLDKFYSDTKRWAFTFQKYAFVSRVMEQEQAVRQHSVAVLERSVYSDRFCFAKNCYEMGFMTEVEWNLYRQWFGWLVDQHATKPTGFIYLRADPQVCYERMVKRARSEEASVSFDYLKRLHDRHEQWLMHKHDLVSYLRDIPVLVLDCNRDFEHDQHELTRHLDSVSLFFGIHFRASPTMQSRRSARV